MERKQKFIAQLRAGGQVSRTVDDIGDSDAISYAEFKAASSGNPLILEREQLVADISRLATLERVHHDEQRRLKFETRQAEAAAAAAARDVTALEHALTIRQPTGGDRFTMTIRGRRHASRADAGQALLHVLAEAHNAAAQRGRDTDEVIGTLGGFDLQLQTDRGSDDIVLGLDGIPAAITHVDVKDLSGDNPGHSLVRRLENHLNRIDALLDQRRNAEHEHRARADESSRLLGTPFERAAELNAAKQRLVQVEKELAELEQPPSQPTDEHAGRNRDPSEAPRPGTQGPSTNRLATPRPRDATPVRTPQPLGRDL